MEQVHASCVELGGAGVLIRGISGAGKSDLALRLIDRGAALVADDRVDLERDGDGIYASAPSEIAGMLEIRGMGVVRLKTTARTRVRLVIDLMAPENMERLPEANHCTYQGLELPVLGVAPFEASAPAKVRFALERMAGRIESVS